MFTEDFCEDWDSTKKQDDFIKKYFSKKKVNLTKGSNVSETIAKSRNIDIIKNSTSEPVNKRSLNYEWECNKKRKKKKLLLQDSSEGSYSEIHSQSQNEQATESSKSESKQLKHKKKKKSINKSEIISDKSSKQMRNIEDSNAETIIGMCSIDSIKSADLPNCETDSNYLKLKKKKKKRKHISKETSLVPDKLFNETETATDTTANNPSKTKNNLSEDISNSLKMKKRMKKLKNKAKNIEKVSKSDEFLNAAKPTSFEVSHDLAVKKSNLVQSKAYQKLQVAKFRYLNEILYTNSGKDALSYFQQNTDEYQDYHEGYQSQVSKWPINPVDIIIQEISQLNKQDVIADLGCGAAKIAEVFPNRTVHSFDLIALKNFVTACDMANVPLPSSSVDAIVYCLSLMGTNWKDYLKEGYRILKLGGIMKIAEIESRIENLQHFIKEIEHFGFSLINQNLSHKMFVFLNFKRIKRKNKSSKVPAVTLKPCLYKKR